MMTVTQVRKVCQKGNCAPVTMDACFYRRVCPFTLNANPAESRTYFQLQKKAMTDQPTAQAEPIYHLTRTSPQPQKARSQDVLF